MCDVGAHTDAASVSISKGPTVNMGYIFRSMSCEIFSRGGGGERVSWMDVAEDRISTKLSDKPSLTVRSENILFFPF